MLPLENPCRSITFFRSPLKERLGYPGEELREIKTRLNLYFKSSIVRDTEPPQKNIMSYVYVSSFQGCRLRLS